MSDGKIRVWMEVAGEEKTSAYSMPFQQVVLLQNSVGRQVTINDGVLRIKDVHVEFDELYADAWRDESRVSVTVTAERISPEREKREVYDW